MEAYNQLWKAIIRPPRAHYQVKDLGPVEATHHTGVRIVRSDFEIVGARGQKMQCSHFEPSED
jgi:hypothetical protein